MNNFSPNSFNTNNLTNLKLWLTATLNFWQEKITDKNGGFFESLDQNSNPIPTNERNAFVVARIIFTYSNAFFRTRTNSFSKTAQHGFLFLTEKCQSPEGGWYKTVTNDGESVNKTQDGYTQAFVLLAMAWYFRAFKENKAIEIAENTWSFIENYLIDKEFGGLLERYDPSDSQILLPRTQNASMHLLEALQALYVATQDRKWLERANLQIEFSRKHFIDYKNGGVIEFFDKEWKEWSQPLSSSLAPDKSCAMRQTGHILERSKLMLEQFKFTGDVSLFNDANLLFECAKQGVMNNQSETLLQGLVRDSLETNESKDNKYAGTLSLWQSLEYLALLATRTDTLREDHSIEIQKILTSIQKSFIRKDGYTWYNQLNSSGEPIDNKTSATRLLYHLYPAIESFCDLV